MSTKRRRVDTDSPEVMDTAAQLPTPLFTEAEHAELDTLVNHRLLTTAAEGEDTNPADVALLRPGTGRRYRAAALIIGIVVAHSKGRLRSEFGSFTKSHPMDPPSRLRTLLREKPGLVSDALAAAVDGKFKDIRESYDFLRAQPTRPDMTQLQKDAVEKSWQVDFKGDSAKFFLEILRNYQRESYDAFYARYVTITQSSGMGKSRMVDEAGKQVTLIPVNLSRAQPFPPPDRVIRDWLFSSETNTSQETYLRSLGLLYGLFRQTWLWLDKNVTTGATEASVPTRSQVSAAMLRDYLLEGMSFEQHGHNRRLFHQAVKDSAQEFLKIAVPHTRKKLSTFDSVKDECSVILAAEALCGFLGPQKNSEPTVILCFDEAHELTGNSTTTLSRFSELRRALHLIRHLPIWTVFLSTAGKFHLFTPDVYMDPSSRITKTLRTYPVITETGFDEFAEPVASGSKTLSCIASTHHIAHLGRAMFAARFDQGSKSVRENIIGFAQAKLLCFVSGNPRNAPPPDAQLVCLAVRLCLDFTPTSWGAGDAERRQVERHMRIALSSGFGSESMVTTSSSEPLLAEASYMTMREQTWTPVDALRDHILLSGISVGDRGEVVAALLMLLARDVAAARNPEVPSEPLEADGAHRVISVTHFLQALLETDNEELVAQPPTSYYDSDAAFETLGDAFKDGKIWFNHFDRVDDCDVINQEFLWRLISRGAAIICATNELAIDILVPVLFGDILAKEDVTAILIQVKNSKHYTEKPTSWLFDAMDPIRIGLFSKGVTPLPVIRMVFAMASKNSVVSYLKPRKVVLRSTPGPPVHPPGKKTSFTAYDIWCASMTSKTFRVISENHELAYEQILSHARDLPNPYTPMENPSQFSRERGDMRRAMKPGVSSLAQHHRRYIDVQGKVEVVLDDSVPERVQEDLRDRFFDVGEDSMVTDV